MKKFKLTLSLVLLGLFFIILIQNSNLVTYKFLFWEISISQIILLPIILLIGFLLGFSAAHWKYREKNA
ncbi:MAG: hypothetical protein COV74_10425 [Candidatus Omnitrophica bacterium CG11_big_fil_rev_8_21_14_0_20_45_26]|uniref:Lipopolysaccharide assembly protein A domain-containing protein n=1 Tax=Candidatus Abzuiibacterium crystallinum TaxID=1974748 RepID=A0A2H0LKY6_9BACT|nr:MAG: hypothetical protein COV74_10425 [Candidatus Omnitrophica bacterium CG11_big_fil_rev_8_21_14_0_20_45_26]PIW63917.1 MAG: hypothetical protein COW12_08395 [Candidatus Omnitrophica bacterium CG12_big_fil_rev_8_21_14_0_65_45_16]